ncbi:hypothetical protein QBC42DRAFT_188703 [Cladorrhinum samala]|uniref:DUF2461 domain-containing protein n=1 Tax=Cladorrhinum samala TaxID=585594 RepID=A0AAV9H9V8_9PEZI|nr:hypothetical protein QBC42DRAFT_188703 [Cladorrhinum samala]
MVGRKRKSATVAAEPQPATPEAPASSSSRRRSVRVASTGKTSKYFEEAKPESESESESQTKTKSKPNSARRPSKKIKIAEFESASDDDDDDDDDDDEDDDFKEAHEGAPEGHVEESEEEDDDDDDAPPKVTFIPIPKLRDTGGIEYADDRIHPNTLAFLKDLKANNRRNWLKSNDKEYRRALSDWETYVAALTEKIIEADPTVPELPFKDVNFRIYRDIRFSKDPTPYKPHFSAAFSRTGRKGPYACYYVHLEPGHCYVGGGLWHPDGPALAKLRASIDERPERWKRVLMDPTFRDTFLALPAKKKQDEEAVVRAFADKNKENALKTRPKGFHPEHKHMDLLKLRNFTVGKKLEANVFTRKDGIGEVVGAVEAMVAFITHLNKIVMPDPGDDDDDSDEDEDEGQDENDEDDEE